MTGAATAGPTAGCGTLSSWNSMRYSARPVLPRPSSAQVCGRTTARGGAPSATSCARSRVMTSAEGSGVTVAVSYSNAPSTPITAAPEDQPRQARSQMRAACGGL